MVAQRFPGSPVDTVLRWVEELAEATDFGTWILDAKFSAEHAPERILEALRSLMEESGAASAAAEQAPADLAELRTVFSQSSLRALIADEPER